MITYNFQNIGSDSLYQYLYKCIKNDIVEGKLKSGEKLPSKRNFAKNLGISVITVENAYAQLIDEGYLYSIPKSGFYVADIKEFVNNEKQITEEKIVLSGGDNIYIADFASNQMDAEIFPFSVWTKISREVMADKKYELMINPPAGGVMELRKNIAGYLKTFRGMEVKPEQIIIGAGSDYLYTVLAQLFEGKAIYGVGNPGYHKIARIYDGLRVKCEYINLDEDGVKLEELIDKKVDILHISPAHHFPTGQVMPIGRRYELLGWATKKDSRYIIEDEYDSELRPNGKPIPTLQSIDVSDKVIYMNTFTKTLCSTVRISYMVLPMTLLNKYYEKLGYLSGTVSNFEQYTLSKFIEDGYFEKHINRLRNYYQKKRDMIINGFMKGKLGKHITICEEKAGVHFIIKINTTKKEDEIVSKALSKGIRLMPLSKYYAVYDKESGKMCDNEYVVNYEGISVDKIDEICDILCSVIE